jgi:hypothetical protein
MPNISKSNEDSGQVTTSPFDKSHECRLLKTSLQNCCDCSLLLAKRLTVYWPGSSFESKMGSLTCKKQSPKVWQKRKFITPANSQSVHHGSKIHDYMETQTASKASAGTTSPGVV